MYTVSTMYSIPSCASKNIEKSLSPNTSPVSLKFYYM